MVCHRFLTSLMSHFSPHSAIYELFCSVKRKEFQILTWCKFLFGIKGWRRWKGSTTNCHKAPINPSDIFLVHGKEQSTIQIMQPNFLNYPGPELSLLGFHALSPIWVLFQFSPGSALCVLTLALMHVPKSSVMSLGFYCTCASRGIPPPSSCRNSVLDWQHPWGDFLIFSED